MLIRMWSNRNSYSFLEGIQNGTANLENGCHFLLKVNIVLKHDVAIIPLGVSQK